MVVHFAVWALLAQSGECPSALEAGQRAYNARNYVLAVTEFERARTLCTDRSSVLLALGQAQMMAQRLEESIATFDTLLKSDSRNKDALKLRGDALYILGREPEAEKSLKAAIAVDPAHTVSRYALGRIYYQQNRFPEAIEMLRNVIEQDPGHFRAHDNLALCYAALRQDADALKHFLKALDLVHKQHPEYDTVYANAANFFLERNEFQKAFQLGVEAAKRNPRSARNFFLTGKALARLEKPELSIRWFREAASLDPAYSEPHYWLANVYRKLGKTEDANQALAKFRELSKAPKVKR